jgi:hypothetical protein
MGCKSSKSLDVLEASKNNTLSTKENTISAEDAIPSNHEYNRKLSWGERRNSNKEKDVFMKDRIKLARLELGNRISYRGIVKSKCPNCGDMGPDHSNQYCGYYLIVFDVITKTKCRRCNINFSFEHYGVVKSVEDAINMIVDEMSE